MDIATSSALEIASAVAAGDVSPLDIVDAALERIDRLNAAVNAIVWRRDDAARADARAAADRLARGEQPRIFEGVPFTAKDLCAIADGPTNMGSRAFEGHRFGVDAEIVARLRAAGAILIGTSASSEFGARPTTESALFGATRNPWNLERTAGGSSGGAGVSAALGFAPLNQGSDAGGSLRMPAASCGVVGLKPQRARITLGPVMSEEWGGLDVYGPITRTVGDAAAFLDVTAGPLAGDPYWAPAPERSFASATTEDPPTLRIAIAYERDGEKVDPACIDAVRDTASLLRELGHVVEEDRAPALLPLEEPFLIVSTVGIATHALTDEQLELIEPRNRKIYEFAAAVGAVDYNRALHQMHREARRVLAFFDDYDVLVTPALPRPAPPIGEIGADIDNTWQDYKNWMCWTWPFNATGQPAMAMPAAISPDGLPVGVQLVARPCEERTILSLGAQLERARPWRDRHPPLW